MDLVTADLHGSLEDPAVSSMNFLNEVTSRYPQALSFAPGRPVERYFDLESVHGRLRAFSRHLADDMGYSQEEVRRTLCQYGRTKGIVHGLIARHLARDAGMEVDPESVVVTVGCQEAMFIVLRALRANERDVLLSVSPMYVGLTGAARLVDMPVLPVASGTAGIDLDDLRAQIRAARARGLRPRACYIVPDFANPSGLSLDLAVRRALLQVAERENILLLEDNPYGVFHGGEGTPPTLKALDKARRVVYLGSFAKTVLPGARVGYAVADQRVAAADGGIGLFADQLSKIKSMVSVNTSPLAQAVVGGALLEHDFSLEQANDREREIYRDNLRRLVGGLRSRFGDSPSISWNVPSGGFFVCVTVPFAVDDDLLEHSARSFGVLWTPMRHFYNGPDGDHRLRLSVSSLTGEQIDEGLDRIAALFAEQTTGSAPAASPLQGWLAPPSRKSR
ncbi:PLP-dependent aminotransferase family protein [Streptomyces californicus]|uniref:aminotransferase-like domain-containing protein n=1 Tax=Streptomyces californicus TaxID=67351 RepID=UPI00296F6C92|nr:PLP-dependent aminotransferase family protein [Streptomyces californicus]MDW4901629.1 PLP-dependent aminotransferase family protein [Streptomyces californicus]